MRQIANCFNSVVALDPSQNFVSSQYLKMHCIDKILIRVCINIKQLWPLSYVSILFQFNIKK